MTKEYSLIPKLVVCSDAEYEQFCKDKGLDKNTFYWKYTQVFWDGADTIYMRESAFKKTNRMLKDIGHENGHKAFGLDDSWMPFHIMFRGWWGRC